MKLKYHRSYSVGWIPDVGKTNSASADASNMRQAGGLLSNNNWTTRSKTTNSSPVSGPTRRKSHNDQVALDMAHYYSYLGPPAVGGPGFSQKASTISFDLHQDDYRSLHQVARDGDVDMMINVLDILSDPQVRCAVNELNKDQLAPLHYAARYNHYTMVRLLIDRGADVKIKGRDGLTPLHLAARHKRPTNVRPRKVDVQDQMEVLTDSLDNVSSQVAKMPKSRQKLRTLGVQLRKLQPFMERPNVYDDSPPPSYESSFECLIETVIALLVSKGAEVNSKDKYSLTPLHYAAMRGNVQAATDLLQCKGINIESRDADGMTPIHLAAINGHTDIARLLMDAGVNLRSRDESYATPLLRAAAEGNLDIIAMLTEAAEHGEGWVAATEMIMDQDADENTALHLATENGHRNVVHFLVSKGADVNAARQKYVFPLHLAAMAGNVDIIHLLLESNERIDCLNADQETPLHRATEFNHVPVIDLLISHGAGIERRDRNNFTPLLTAASKGHVEAIECLLRHGADPSARDKDDRTAIYWAAQCDKHDALVAILRNPRAKELLLWTDVSGNSPLHVSASMGFMAITQSLVDVGCPLDLKNQDDRTALHLAAMNGRTKIVRSLLRYSNVGINGEDEDGNTPLHLAASMGYENVVKSLIEVGANLETRNGRLWTPLDCASNSGHANTVRILLEAGSLLDAQEKTKTTSLHLAAAAGNVDVVRLLLDSGADVSLQDDYSRNCLEMAIEYSRRDVVRAIVNSNYWMNAMLSVKYTEDGTKNTPLRSLIKKMPDVAADVFARCTSTNQLPSDHPLFMVNFDYQLLDDTFEVLPNPSSKEDKHDNQAKQYYSNYGKRVKENHPLMIMVRSRQQKLLSHPLCVSLLHLKWTKFGRYVYYSNLLLYVVFLASLSIYILTIPPPIVKNSDYAVEVIHFWDETTDTIYDGLCNLPMEKRVKLQQQQQTITQVAKRIVIVLAIAHIFKECLELYMMRLNYFGFENMVEWGCYITSLILVFDFSDCSHEMGVRDVWQWQVGSAAIFLAWMNLALFVSKFPYLGLYVVMFTDVCRTFFKVCFVFFFFITAFAFSFNVVMYFEDPFDNPFKCIVRVMVMMLGEFNFEFIMAEGTLLYPIPSFGLFVLTLMFISVVTMNLLIGLAVQDIKGVKGQATLKRLAMQVDLVLHVESVLPAFLQQRFAIHSQAFVPNRPLNSVFEMFWARMNNTEEMREALSVSDKFLSCTGSAVIRCKQSEIDELRIKQDNLTSTANALNASLDVIKGEYLQLQKMTMLLLRHEGIHWDEDDDK